MRYYYFALLKIKQKTTFTQIYLPFKILEISGVLASSTLNFPFHKTEDTKEMRNFYYKSSYVYFTRTSSYRTNNKINFKIQINIMNFSSRLAENIHNCVK